MSPLATAATITLFIVVGTVFLFANLLVGMLLRPTRPTREKGEIYECGEATIGSSHIQFDLRFYVIALLFLVLDVEVAFFFPWANVFGTASQLADPGLSASNASGELNPTVEKLYTTLGSIPPSDITNPELQTTIHQTGSSLAIFALMDVLVFFAVVLVGFAYLWHRGDINWVRAVSARTEMARRPIPEILASEPDVASEYERPRNSSTPAIPVSSG